MTTKSKYSGNGKLTIGDGSQLSISHIGNVHLPSSNPLLLKNILLVPSITKNLISISRFTLENYVIVELDSSCCYVKDKHTRAVLLQGMLKNGLYQLTLPSTSEFSSSALTSGLSPEHHCHNNTTTVSSNNQQLVALWHSRLGHPNREILNKVLSNLQIHISSSPNTLICDACQYGKMHQHSFPSVPLHTTGASQLIHSDVWGPAPQLSLEGYRYYVSFLDDFTRYIRIFPLRQKSEAASVFLHFNKMVERQFHVQIKLSTSRFCSGTNSTTQIKNTKFRWKM